jgi:predicted outer membrane protein
MKQTTLQKLKREIARLTKSTNPKTVKFARAMIARYPELRHELDK